MKQRVVTTLLRFSVFFEPSLCRVAQDPARQSILGVLGSEVGKHPELDQGRQRSVSQGHKKKEKEQRENDKEDEKE